LLHSSLSDEQDVRSGLETILVSSKLLLTLINNVIDFSKIESGKMSAEEVPTHVYKLVKETIDSVMAMAKEKHVSIISVFHGHLPQNVLVDGLKARQILTNLIGNAIKFTREGSEIRVEVFSDIKQRTQSKEDLPIEPTHAILKFSVTDQGPGIPADKIGDLFGRFVQLDQAQETKSRYGGSGLGLHISQQFALLMKGRLWVEKTVIGAGTMFSYQFPCKTSCDSPKGPETDSLDVLIERLRETAPKLSIIVAEDNTINQRVIVRLLNRFGFECTVVANGVEVVDLVQSGKFDLVFMDLHMPLMDGIAAARKIRDMQLTTIPRITAVTAHVLKEEMDACANAGMDFYISKPITMWKLYKFFKTFILMKEKNTWLSDKLVSPTPTDTLTFTHQSGGSGNSVMSEIVADLILFDPSSEDILIVTPNGFQRML